MDIDTNKILMWMTLIAVCGAFLAILTAMLLATWKVVRDEWRKCGDRSAKAVFIAAAFAGTLYGGAKLATVSYPKTEAGRAYLVDRGSYVTNDYVHLDFERRIVPDDAALVVERREVASTNDTDWAEFLRTTFAELPVPTDLPCENATNWNWIVYADWAPPPSVHTNGILEVRWGTSRKDAAHRAAGLAIGVPVQTSLALDGDRLAVPDVRVYTARDYVQDGLVCLWDGIENVGYGVHDGAATGWVDLVGGLSIPLCRDAFFTGDSLQILVSDDWASASSPVGNYCSVVSNTKVPQNLKDAFATTESTTVESVWRIADKETNPNNNAGKAGVVLDPTESPFTSMGYLKYGDPHYITFNELGHTGYVPREDEIVAQSAVFVNNGKLVGYIDGVQKVTRSGDKYNSRIFSSVYRPLVINGGSYYKTNNFRHVIVHSIRLYNRALTPGEVAHNYRVDCNRFWLGAASANAARLEAEAAALISAGIDAITGTAPALGEAVQEEDPASDGKKGSGE